MQNAQGYAHGRGYADGGGSADHHFADGGGYLAVVGVGVGDFFGGEAALVEHDYAALGPLDWLGYVHGRTIVTDVGRDCSKELGFPDWHSMLRGYKGTVVSDDWAIGAQQCCAPTGSRFARWDALKLAPTTPRWGCNE